MKEVILQYDEVSGAIYDKNGLALFSWLDLQYKEVSETLEFTPDPLNKLTKLKSMNLSVAEILELKEAGLLDE